MDDEEFMGNGSRRNSTIPLREIGDLVTFLKGLGTYTTLITPSETVKIGQR